MHVGAWFGVCKTYLGQCVWGEDPFRGPRWFKNTNKKNFKRAKTCMQWDKALKHFSELSFVSLFACDNKAAPC